MPSLGVADRSTQGQTFVGRNKGQATPSDGTSIIAVVADSGERRVAIDRGYAHEMRHELGAARPLLEEAGAEA
jgi:hypothetical protein